MKNIGLGLIGLLLMVLLGCASMNPSFGIMSFGQKDSGKKQTLDGLLETETFVVVPIGSSFSNDDHMGLKIGRLTKDGKLDQYYFRAEAHTTGWIFTNDIALKIDDKTYRLHDDSPNRKVQSGSYVIEITTYDINEELLENILSATTFSVELYRRVVTLDEEEFGKVKEFILEKYQSFASIGKDYIGDPSGIIIGTWYAAGNYLIFEDNKFLIQAGAGGTSSLDVLKGFYSFNDDVLTLFITKNFLDENWVGEKVGKATIAENMTLQLSRFEGGPLLLFLPPYEKVK